jgi:hypothetical protein
MEKVNRCDICGSHGSDNYDYCVLECDTVYSGGSLMMFRKTMLLSFSCH